MYLTRYIYFLVLPLTSICAANGEAHSLLANRGHHDNDGNFLASNLTRRTDDNVDPFAGASTAYFTVGSPSDAGCCSTDQLNTLNSWLSEIALLHTAVLNAMSGYETDLGIQELITLWLGIEFYDNDVDSDSYGLWNNLLDAVSNFLAGEGLKNAVTTQPPWLFCNDGYSDADEAQWDQPAKDSTGQFVRNGDNEYFKLQDVFPRPKASGWEVFWAKLLNAYEFDAPNSGQTLCAVTYRAAFTSKKSAQASFAAEPNTVTTGAYDRHVTLCPYAFNPVWSHKVPELATVISYQGYPVPGNVLSEFTTKSATLYHELFHLTDTEGTTADPFKSMLDCSNAARQQNSLISTNPENFVLFATALYIYKNPPATPESNPDKPAIIFSWDGEARLASEMTANRS